MQQCDASGAVGVVLNVSDLGQHAVFVVTTEVDQTVLALVATTDVTRCDATLVVTSTGLRQGAQQRLLGGRAGDLGEVCNRGTATTRSRGLVFTNSHDVSLPVP